MTAPLRQGSTLIELLITVVIIGVVSGVATLAARVIQRPSPDDPQATLADSLSAAIAHSRTIHVAVDIHGDSAFATAWPDGSVTADSVFRTAALSGRRLNAR
jgi:prepilin-type N-terminal cleavage/methylation domain-containing protein